MAVEDVASLSPPAIVVERETHQKLHELIDALPSESRELIRAAYFEGLTLTEAGQRLGIGKAWASRLHARALKRLARALRLAGVAD
jgi:RNA polymerase sigma factor for flagellar operon FliA